ncbi:hypothetical protein V495_01081 [Pseudogymnoascus sp. VKM F-4514 (FW-929)]|nr:hypothetical protein V495_01081 [Pseudogymnoascus sp. VKM F-4514 (FW-929)]KFY56226.1 hypothetical protein V497_06441 [Pseudogymnoascus sp. VKM F-4516 (FW-969)]
MLATNIVSLIGHKVGMHTLHAVSCPIESPATPIRAAGQGMSALTRSIADSLKNMISSITIAQLLPPAFITSAVIYTWMADYRCYEAGNSGGMDEDDADGHAQEGKAKFHICSAKD